MDKNLCIIPVRGGSKGIPGKNARKIYKNISLLEWTINQAKSAFPLNNIFVSTEDHELKNITLNNGIFLVNRPMELATDDATTSSVVKHLLKEVDSKCEKFNSITILQVTSPLRQKKDILNAVNMINQKNYDSVLSVYQSDNSAAKTYILEEGNAKSILPNYEFLSRQKLPIFYRRNGAIFSVKRELFDLTGKLWGGDLGLVIMEKERSIDIDNFEDLENARKYLCSYQEK